MVFFAADGELTYERGRRVPRPLPRQRRPEPRHRVRRHAERRRRDGGVKPPDGTVRESGEPERRGVGQDAAAFVVLTVIWGTTWAAIRFGLEGIPPLTGVGAPLRRSPGAVLLARRRSWRGVALGRDAERALALALQRASPPSSCPYGIIYWAEQTVPSGLASILFATFPLWLVLWAGGSCRTRSPGPAPAGRRSRRLRRRRGHLLRGLRQARRRRSRVARGARSCWSPPRSRRPGASAVKRWGKAISPLSLAAVPMLLTASSAAPLALVVRARRADLDFACDARSWRRSTWRSSARR